MQSWPRQLADGSLFDRSVRRGGARASFQKGLAALGVLLWFLSGMFLLVALLGTPWML